MTGFILLVALLVGVLVVLSFSSRELRRSIVIEASPRAVWAVLIDLEGYHDWNAQLTYLGGTVAPGGRLHLRRWAAHARPDEFTATISYWREEERLAWLSRAGLPRLLDREHFFELYGLGRRRTRLVNRVEYRGWLAPLGFSGSRRWYRAVELEQMNQALKAYVEKEAGAEG